jgi:hypothetical protein
MRKKLSVSVDRRISQRQRRAIIHSLGQRPRICDSLQNSAEGAIQRPDCVFDRGRTQLPRWERNCLQKSYFGKAEEVLGSDSGFVPRWATNQTMKKLLCILASAALLGACEQKTDNVVAPATSPAPDKKTEHNTTVVNPPATTEKTKETTTNNNTTTTAPSSSSSSSTTTTTSSPSP